MPNNTQVDERIVQAKFDATDFEKGVNKTVKKLDELKKSLNLKDASKSVTELADETKKATEKASSSLEKLENRFTSFTGMIKNKLLGGLADQVAGVFFKIENSITSLMRTLGSQQVSAGMGKYEQMLTSVRTMVSAGVSQSSAYEAIKRLAEYSDQTSYSLDQMTDAMSKMVAAGVDVNTAAKSVEGISNACAIAGVNATDAARAYYNLSQAYSSGVLRYTDYRSLELLNMTTADFKQQMLDAAVAAGTLTKQVKKVGKETQTVYKTTNKKDKKVTAGKTVNANNLTDALRYNFMNKEAMNQLFGGQYYLDVIDPDEIKDKMIELAEQEFLTTHSQEELNRYRDQMTEANYRQKMQELGTEPFIKKYGELAYKAYLAAKEARSLTDVFNTLKDVISTGWSTSFEYIFGKLDEATEFFTWLTENNLAEALYSIGEWRNKVLEVWATTASGSGMNGRDYLLETLKELDNIVGDVTEAFSKFIPNAEDIGAALYIFSWRARDAVKRFREWLNTVPKGQSQTRLEKFTSIVGILANMMGVVGHAMSTAFALVRPVFEGILDFIDKITTPLANLGENEQVFTKLRQSIDNLYIVLKPVVDVLKEVFGIVGEIASFFLSMAIDGAVSNIQFFADTIGLIIEAFGGESAQQKEKNGVGVLENIRQEIKKIESVCSGAYHTVVGFFNSLLEDFKELLGLNKQTDGKEKGGFFKNVTNFFDTNEFIKNAEAWLEQAGKDIDAWLKKLPENTVNFAQRIYDHVFGIFYEKHTMQTGGYAPETVYKATDLKLQLDEWLLAVKTTVSDFVAELPGKISEFFQGIPGVFFEIKKFLFGDGTKEAKSDNGKEDPAEQLAEEIPKTLDEWIAKVRKSIEDFIADIPNKMKGLYDYLKETIYSIFYKKVTLIDYKGEKQTNFIKTPFTRFIEGIFQSVVDKVNELLPKVSEAVKNFVENLPATIASFGGKLSEGFNSLFEVKVEVEKNGKKTTEKVATPLKLWIDDIVGSVTEYVKTEVPKIFEAISAFFQSLPARLSKFGANVGDAIHNMFYERRVMQTGGYAPEFYEVETPFKKALDNTVIGIITHIESKSKEVWEGVKSWFSSLPEQIAGIFKKETKSSDKPAEGTVGAAIQSFGDTIGGFIADIPKSIAAFFTSSIKQLGILWDNLYAALSGNGEEKDLEKVLEETAPEKTDAEPTKSKWEEFVESLGVAISTAFANIPGWIVDGLDLAIKGIDWAIKKAADALSPKQIAEDLAKTESGDVVESVSEAVAESTGEGDTPQSRTLLDRLKTLGQTIATLITQTIPGFLTSGFESIKNNAGGWFASLKGIFDGWLGNSEEQKGLEEKAGSIGTKIQEFIEKIPEYIKSGLEKVRALLGGETSNDAAEPVQEVTDGVKKELKKTADEAEKQTGGTKILGVDFASIFETIGETIKACFGLVLPYIIEGWTNTVTMIGKVVGTVGDLISGEKTIEDVLVEVFGEDSGKKINEKFTAFGGAIIDFFNKTIPEAFTTLSTKISEMGIGNFFDSIFGGLFGTANAEEASKEAAKNVTTALQETESKIERDWLGRPVLKTSTNGEKEKKGAENAFTVVGGIINSITNAFSDIANSPLAKVAIVLALLIPVLSKLSDIIGIASTLENASEAIKWSGISAAILGIVGIVAYLATLVNSGDTEKLELMTDTIEKLVGFFERIATAIMIIEGIKTGGALIETVGGIFEWLDNKQQIKAGSFEGDEPESFKDKLIDKGADLIMGPLKSFLNSAAVGAGAGVTASFLGAGIEDLMYGLSQSFTDLGIGIESAIGFLAPAVDQLANMNTPITSAIESVTKLTDLVGKLKTFMDEAKVEDDKTYKQDFFYGLGAFFLNISGMLGNLEKVKNPEEQLTKLDELLDNPVFYDIFGKMHAIIENAGFFRGGTMDYENAAYGFTAIGQAFSIFGQSIADVDEKDVDAVDKTIKLFNNITENLAYQNGNPSAISALLNGDNSLSAFGTELQKFASSMRSFFANVKLLPSTEASEINMTERKLKLIIMVAQGMAKAVNALQVMDMTNGIQDTLDKFGNELPRFGYNIGSFISSIDEDLPDSIDLSRIEAIATSVSAIGELAAGIGALGTNGLTPSDIPRIIEEYVKGLAELIRNDNDFAELGFAIATPIAQGLQTAFDNPTESGIQIRIAPILDLDNVREQLSETLGVDGISLSGLNLNLPQQLYDEMPEDRDYTAALNAITDKLDTLDKSIDSLGSDMASMKLYLDTERLVGGLMPTINRELNTERWFAERGNYTGVS